MNKKVYTIMILLILTIISFLLIFNYFNNQENHSTTGSPPKEPQLNIGCSRVVWIDENETLTAHVSNMNGTTSYSWWIDGINNNDTTVHELTKSFPQGAHSIRVTASNDTITLEKEITITGISSAKDISVKPVPSSTLGTWKFQASCCGTSANVQGIQITLNEKPAGTSQKCTPVTINGMRAGNYTWSAQYHDQIIGNGTIEVPETKVLHISKVDVASQYRTGDTISAKLVVGNSGTMDIKGFHVYTHIINNDLAWMGDIAIREYTFDYKNTISPGESAQVPITATIPEKVKGVKPTGHYTITIEVHYDDQKTCSLTKETEVI
jgi:hypothetical protein